MSVLLLPFGKFSWIPACAGMTMDGPVPSAASRAQAGVQNAFRVTPAKARVQDAFRVIPARARIRDAFRVIPAKARVQDAFRVTPAKAGVQGQ